MGPQCCSLSVAISKKEQRLSILINLILEVPDIFMSLNTLYLTSQHIGGSGKYRRLEWCVCSMVGNINPHPAVQTGTNLIVEPL